ncbi:MAG: phenylacetate--CoA ligase family protein [Verrucomicrobia bacterium]|nr:phenylacetate--CoA ligase family protein [Verrucomicrobiota bacterium]
MSPSRLRWGIYFAWHLQGQAKFTFRPWEHIARAQTHRVRRMAGYAYRTVPYYRETFDRLGLTPADFKSVEDLTRLPILERAQIQRDPEYFCSRERPTADLLELRSGGSTGAPRRVFHDLRGVFQNAAHGERERSIWTRFIGRRFGYRELIVAPPHNSTFKVQQFCRERGFYPSGVGIERRYLSLLDSPERVVAEINSFRPDVVHTYGSFLGILFHHLSHAGPETLLHRPKILTYTSDGLSDSVRRLIGQEYHVPIFSTYQAVEAFKIGFECECHRGIHLNADLYPLRIIGPSGQTLPPGESGEVVVSNLVNGGMVLLNYRLGDIATLLPEPCPCGRTLPLLSFPQGRSDDLIELPSGRVLHPQAIRAVFFDRMGVLEYQVVHEEGVRFRVSLLTAPTCDRAATRERVAERFEEYVGAGVVTEIRFVDSIDRTAGGKFRSIISQRARAAAGINETQTASG